VRKNGKKVCALDKARYSGHHWSRLKLNRAAPGQPEGPAYYMGRQPSY